MRRRPATVVGTVNNGTGTVVVALLLLATAAALNMSPRVFGPSSRRGRSRQVLPIYSPDYSKVLVPIPIPGDETRTLRYQFTRPSELEFVRDVKKYGCFVQVVSERREEDYWGEFERVGVIVDVAMAQIADDGKSAALVGRCRDRARCVVGETVKVFPYQAAQVDPLLDRDEEPVFAIPMQNSLEADVLEEELRDPLSYFDVMEDDPEKPLFKDLDAARAACVETLDCCLAMAAKLEPHFGRVDEFGKESVQGEYERMRVRLQKALVKSLTSVRPGVEGEDDASLAYLVMAMASLPPDITRKALTSTNAARRYAVLTHFLKPMAKEFVALTQLSDIAGGTEPLPPRPAPFNASPALALLRPGRRLQYWFSSDLGWKPATILDVVTPDPDQRGLNLGLHFRVQFHHDPHNPIDLPLAGADRSRFQLLPV